ncbi:MAG: aminotransferase class III-fold pyridoxal phosphate-dependent enzyme [Chloroflexi bacterium]|nr:aminotransferase class III-fold pyridoxal phosphate-dependent enzyme [Chloroflexota bacterium]
MKTSEAEALYVTRHPKSKAVYDRAIKVLPDGITHIARTFAPFPPQIVSMKGSHKQDLDGHDYVCWVSSHGAAILGYGHPAVVEAVRDQVGKMTHANGCHEGEVELAERVLKLYPGMEKIRFVSSGSEANMMAVRLARVATGRRRLVKFQGHFHGWADATVVGMNEPWDKLDAGISPGLHSDTVVLPDDDIAKVKETLSKRDVACVIVEGGGAHMGQVPIEPAFVKELRKVCTDTGTVLLFDEVVTGFRWSEGGWQKVIGVQPDMTTLAKILMGGLPGGAVMGKDSIMMALSRSKAPNFMAHPGTFNANPLSVAAGIACMKLVSDGSVQRKSDATADKVKRGMHAILQERGISGALYGESSIFHVYIGECSKDPTEYRIRPPATAHQIHGPGMSQAAMAAVRRNALFNGVDCWMRTGIATAAHTDEDVARTLEAFTKAVETGIADGVMPLRKK